MAATVEWRISNDSTENYFAPASNLIRFKGANNNIADTNDPLIRPTSGSNFSYEKCASFFITASAGATSLNALRVKLSTDTPGFPNPGPTGTMQQRYEFVATASYRQPQQYSGGSGGVGGLMPGAAGSPLGTSEINWTRNGGALGAMTDFGETPNARFKDATDYADHLYLQLEVFPGSGGTMSTYQIIAVYNEI